MIKKTIPLLYTLDNNYSMQAGVSLTSLFENNQKLSFRLYLVSDGISDENKDRITKLTEKYENEICIIDMPDLDKLSGVNLSTYSWAKAAYCRLFLCDLVPKEIDRLLYLDPDTIVVDKIDPIIEILFSDDFEDYYGAACLDPSYVVKKYYGFKRNEFFFNTGLMLINLKKWRDCNIQEVFVNEIIRRNGKSIDVDQGYINCVLINKIQKLPANYNVSSPFFKNYEDICRMFASDEWYTKQEFDQAVKQPVMIHFSGGKNDRPWFANSDHPMKDEWEKYLSMTDWKDTKLEEYPPMKAANKVSRLIRNMIIKVPFLVKFLVKKRYGFVPIQYRDL